MPNPWETGHLIQGQYLNSVQELISDWADNVLLQATGAAVVVPAATAAPAELVIDGQMRFANDDEQVVISGPAGSYNIFATTRRGRTDFVLAASLTDVTAQYSRQLGVAEFDGTAITEVVSHVREVNVSHIDGHPPEQDAPRAAAIPAGRSDATLDPEWLPNLEDGLVPVGGVREVWVPTPGVYAVPSGWALLDGQTIPAGQHGFRDAAGTLYPGAVTLPNLIDKHVLGASPTAPAGQVGNGSGTPPGRNASAGTNAVQSFQHTHGRAGHGHSVNNHAHGLESHTHTTFRHFHSVDIIRLNIATPGGASFSHSQDDAGIGPPNPSFAPTTPGSAGAPANDATAASTTSMTGGAVSNNDTSLNQSLVPLSVGVVYMMRVV